MFDLNTVTEQKSMGLMSVSFFQNVGLYNVWNLKLKALEAVQTFLPKASLCP